MKKIIVKTVKLWSLLAVMLTAATLYAEMPKPTISGFIDTTYNYSFNKPQSRIVNGRSFDRKTDAFLLNAFQLNISGNAEEGIGYYGELAFGTDPSIYKGAGTGNDNATGGTLGTQSTTLYNVEVQEAYLTYKCPMSGIQLKAGKFVTFEGIEVIESKDNFTISRGALFGLAEPYTHVGAVAGYAFPSILDVWVGAVNGWDLHTDNNYSKTFVSKIGLNFGEKFFGSFAFYRGQETNANAAPSNTNQRTSIDSTWFIKPISKLTLALQANAGQEEGTNVNDKNFDGLVDGGTGHWYGAGIQPKYDVTDKFFIGARYEWFSDLNGARTNYIGAAIYDGGIFQNITIAPGYNLTENLMARVEYRYDWASHGQAFENRNGFVAYNGVLSPTESTEKSVAAELIYKF
ncbi:MAG: outer membrane beta-barrel protein [Elusimicrobia bacterium]|nr:outer membrane beta-barrel protein [Elusimicrobiota bacterium]